MNEGLLYRLVFFSALSLGTFVAVAMIDPSRYILPYLAGVFALSEEEAARGDSIARLAYLIAMIATLAMSGWIARLPPSRWLIGAAAAGFAAASAACAGMATLDGMAAARVPQGACAGLLIGSTLAAPFMLFRGTATLLAAALLAALTTSALVFGPVLVSIVADFYDWRDVIFAPAVAAGTIVAAVAISGNLDAVRVAASAVADRLPGFRAEALLPAVAFIAAVGAFAQRMSPRRLLEGLGGYQQAIGIVRVAYLVQGLLVLLLVPLFALVAARLDLRRIVTVALAACAVIAGILLPMLEDNPGLGLLSAYVINIAALQIALSCSLVLALRHRHAGRIRVAAGLLAGALVAGGATGAASADTFLETRRDDVAAPARPSATGRRLVDPGRIDPSLVDLSRIDPSVFARAVRDAFEQARIVNHVDPAGQTIVLRAAGGCLLLAALLSLALRRPPRKGRADPARPPPAS